MNVFAICFFLLEASFMPHAMCSSSPLFKPSFNISVLNLLMGFYIIFITEVSDCFKTNELTFRRSLWDEWYDDICHFSWAWKYREIKLSCDYGCSILNIYNFFSCLPKVCSITYIFEHLELIFHHLLYAYKYQMMYTEVKCWTTSLRGRNPSD